jgi:hypothetical protein
MIFFGDWVRVPAFSVSGTATMSLYSACEYSYNQTYGDSGLSNDSPYRNMGVGLDTPLSGSARLTFTSFMCLTIDYSGGCGGFGNPCSSSFTSGCSLSNYFNGVNDRVTTAADTSGLFCFRSGTLSKPEGTITIVDAY